MKNESMIVFLNWVKKDTTSNKTWIQELAPQDLGFWLWFIHSHCNHCLPPYEEELNSFLGAAHPQ